MITKSIVLATAKIHILKQFTTPMQAIQQTYELCLLLQRYTFWSNSQLGYFRIQLVLHCACYCKDTHFEAIHNDIVYTDKVEPIVLATAKIHILKQFTTVGGLFKTPTAIVLATAKIHILKQFTTSPWLHCLILVLCLLLQRYTFWSNSQQRCSRAGNYEIVLATAKIHILKQFTTIDEAVS